VGAARGVGGPLGDRGLSRILVGLGGGKSLLHIGIVERCEELVFLHDGAFVEKHAGDAASDFSGDGRTAARGDVAACIQQGFAAAGADRFVGRGYRDNGLAVPESVDSAADACEDHEATKEDSQSLADLAAVTLSVMDAQ